MSKELNNLLFQYLGSSGDVFIGRDISYSRLSKKDACFFMENKLVPAYSLFIHNNFINGNKDPNSFVYYYYAIDKNGVKETEYERSYNDFFFCMKKQRLYPSLMKSKSGDNVINLFNISGTLWDLDTNIPLVSLCVPNHFLIAFSSLKNNAERKKFLEENLESHLSLYVDRIFMTDDKYNNWRKKFDTYYLHFVRMFNIDIIETANLGSKIFNKVKLLPKMNSLEDVAKYLNYIEDKLIENVLSA